MKRLVSLASFALALSACGAPVATRVDAGSARTLAVGAPVAVTDVAPVSAPPPPPPPPDPEAEARARDAAQQEALERAYPLQGVCYHFLAQVFASPSTRGRVVGYMRRGAQFRAKARVDGVGCSAGFYEVPGPGFVCGGDGYIVGEGPQTFDPSPVPPALDDALPYAYAHTVTDDVPQFWQPPTTDELATARALMEHMRARDDRVAAAADAGVPTPAVVTALSDEAPAEADEVDAPPPPGQTDVEGEESQAGLPSFLRMRMLKGFYVSLDHVEGADTGHWYRTVRGGYVAEDALVPATPPSMRGVVLGGGWHLPLAFVFRTGARRYVQSRDGVRDDGTVDRHLPLVLENEHLVVRDRIYVVSDDGVVVREPAVRLVHATPRPPGIGAHDRWVHVSLATQTLVAYEGDVPVFTTLVSTGKEGHDTPVGVFQIQSKHVSTTMDDDTTPDGAYSIEDVPWTMYFNGNIALHGAFWHNAFGQVRSHGCVNLAPADARWLFSWTTPVLPAAWHGVFADRRHPGTWVVIEP